MLCLGNPHGAKLSNKPNKLKASKVVYEMSDYYVSQIPVLCYRLLILLVSSEMCDYLELCKTGNET